METTERIVESYVRYVKHWATIPNVKCDGQKEIDLFAIDPKNDDCYHIETTISISQKYRALTVAEFAPGSHKVRGKAAAARRSLDFFMNEKFNPPGVKKALRSLGGEKPYKKIIVTWEWKTGVREAAAERGVELWDFRDLMREIAELGRDRRTYFGDDTLRTLTLFVKALDASKK